MDKDKELLLSMQPSDSDDAVEEFKLPPPRARRSKGGRKGTGEVRVSSGSTGCFSWRCCFVWVLSTVVIGGTRFFY